jgi:hypothetical protein
MSADSGRTDVKKSFRGSPVASSRSGPKPLAFMRTLLKKPDVLIRNVDSGNSEPGTPRQIFFIGMPCQRLTTNLRFGGE